MVIQWMAELFLKPFCCCHPAKKMSRTMHAHAVYFQKAKYVRPCFLVITLLLSTKDVYTPGTTVGYIALPTELQSHVTK